MTLKQRLQNPFALVAQGFVAGAILFWATAPSDGDSPPPSAPAESAAAPSATNA